MLNLDTEKKLEEKHLEYSLNIYSSFIKNGINLLFDSYFRPASHCSVLSQNSFSIDSTGNIYKCWHDLTADNFNGNLFGDIYEGINLLKLVSYIGKLDVLCKNECRDCVYLPLCLGGCPEYENAGYHKCTPLKHHAKQMIEFFMKIKGIEK